MTDVVIKLSKIAADLEVTHSGYARVLSEAAREIEKLRVMIRRQVESARIRNQIKGKLR